MENWTDNTIFYHIYPLGLCGAPLENDFSSAAVERLNQLDAWLDPIQAVGANALYLGPVFESSAHGYDTADYYWVDRRLGTNQTLAGLSARLRERGIRLVLDGVFNHVGRHFWAFRDVLAQGEASPYRDWFSNLRFDRRSPYNDPFSYDGWNGHYNLVKLNLANPAVKEHLFGAVESWVRDYDLAGLRLDAADSLDFGFMAELAAFCRRLRPDFWLMGEVIHGDYTRWVNPTMLDSVTNYECYKGLYSSHAEANYFEIAYALNRQFGPGGIYRSLRLYNFADNHDVNRVVSNLLDPAQLYPLYALLFGMPGIPSIYYGSEWGVAGKKARFSDLPLRPQLDPSQLERHAPQPGLRPYISDLERIRQASPGLRCGDYLQLHVAAEQFAFLRSSGSEKIVVAVNSARQAARVDLHLPERLSGNLVDLLHPPARFALANGACPLDLPACQARILRLE
jgi:cyclomaltodextrinase